jgi:hypothetical protein
LSHLRGAWPDGTPYVFEGERNRAVLLSSTAPLSKYITREEDG